MANIADLIQRARTIRIETKSKKKTADRIGGLLLDIVNGLGEVQGLKKAQYGGIVATSADVVSDYADKGYSGPYFYLVGSSLSSLVVYQYTGTGTPAQAFNGAAYDFTDYSEVVSRLDKFGPKIDGLEDCIDEMDKVLGQNVADFQERIPLTNENGWFVIDPQGNVGMQLVNGLLDALGFGANLIAKIKEIITNNTDLIEELNAGTMNAMSVCAKAIKLLNDNGDVIADITPKLTKEDGVYFTDSEGNIMWYIKAYTTEEGGIYFVDENGWIGCQYVDGVWSFSNLSNIGGSSSVSTDHAIIVRANKTLKEARELSNKVNGIVPSLLTITDGSVQTIKTTTISNSTAKKKAVVRLRLHYGAEKYTPDANDIFFNSSCKTDFSDVRFFDSNGNMLKAKFGECFNLGIYRDTRLANTYYITSQGYLVKRDSGIWISKDNAVTWTKIAGTTNVTDYGSDVYNVKSITALYVGKHNSDRDVIFGYAGGKLYKVITDFETMLNDQLVASITEVLDFSWSYNGTTIYPDVQPHALDADINGNLYFGAYQGTQYYHVQIFVSTDGGNTWVEKYLYYNQNEKRQQHVHHIHADKYSSRVFVGIDGGVPLQGPTVIVSDNAGVTWTDITLRLKSQRGHDYYPTYFGQDYMLGGGECYCLGGNAIVRGSSDYTTLDIAQKGFGGVRSFADFGNDDMIVAGISRNSRFGENQIVISTTKGETWKTISRTDAMPETSGDGYRESGYFGLIAADTAPCIFLSGGSYVAPTRIYNGGDYYREVEIEVDDIPASDIVIIAKTGYVMPYPYSTVRGYDDDSLVYRVAFDEGCGQLVQDSVGMIAEVEGSIDWEKSEEPLRFGEYSNEGDMPFSFSSAARISGTLNFGKISALNFSSGYTITMWVNEKNRRCDYDDSQRYSSLNDNISHSIVKIGNYIITRLNSSFCIVNNNDSSKYSRKAYNGSTPQCSDNYYFLAIVIGNSGIEVYINGNIIGGGSSSNWTGWTSTDLSDADIIFGSGDSAVQSCAYISDFCIYNRELAIDDVRAIYKGFNY